MSQIYSEFLSAQSGGDITKDLRDSIGHTLESHRTVYHIVGFSQIFHSSEHIYVSHVHLIWKLLITPYIHIAIIERLNENLPVWSLILILQSNGK